MSLTVTICVCQREVRAKYCDILLIIPASSLCCPSTGSLQEPAANTTFTSFMRASDFVLPTDFMKLSTFLMSQGTLKGGLYNTQTSPGVVTMHSQQCKIVSPSPFPNGFLRSVSASAELCVHALPCTLRREQLSPRLTSLTSNPQLLHSLHGLRHVIDHNTS